MLEKYSVVFGDGKSHAGYNPSASAVPSYNYSASGGASAFLQERQRQQQQRERLERRRAEIEQANRSYVSYNSSTADYHYQIPPQTFPPNNPTSEEMKYPQSDTGFIGTVGNVGIADRGLVTFNQGSWYDPGAEDDEAALSAKLDEVSLAEHSWDDSLAHLEASKSTPVRDPERRGRSSLTTKMRSLLDRASSSVMSGTRRSKAKTAVAPSPSVEFEPSLMDESQVEAYLPARPASRPRSRSRSPSADRHPHQRQHRSRPPSSSHLSRRPSPALDGPARRRASPSGQSSSAKRLQKMHRQQQQQQQLQFQGPGSSSNFQSIRKMRQISRKLQPAAEGVGYAYPELVSTNHTGVGPGAQARAVETAPHSQQHCTLQSAIPGAPLSTPERLHEEGANYRAYLLLSPDDKPPVLDILANLERTPAAPNSPARARARPGAPLAAAEGALHGGRNNRRSLSNRRPVRDATTTPADPVPAPLATPMNSDYANAGYTTQLTGVAPADGPYYTGPRTDSAALAARKGKRAAI
jgi:hypothetical protein